MEKITGVIVYEWRAKCDNCNFARWAGTSEATAKIFARGHWRRNAAHNVYPEYLINPEAFRTAEKMRAYRAMVPQPRTTL